MNVLKAENLSKDYGKFKLDNVSFDLEKGKITGFIGRNGAGKSTTFKCIMDFVHPDSGKAFFFGKPFSENQIAIKENLGFVFGGIDYYKKTKISRITKCTKLFYKTWDDSLYKKYVELFNIDQSKTPEKLSQGMKVKYSIALALAHNPSLLILDEPTSGLDPVSRDEILDIFMQLEDKGITIFFSTHITSDLEKCADNIIYIKDGKIIDDETLDNFKSKYKIVDIPEKNTENKDFIGCKKTKKGYSALILSENSEKYDCYDASLDEIMVHIEKEDL